MKHYLSICLFMIALLASCEKESQTSKNTKSESSVTEKDIESIVDKEQMPSEGYSDEDVYYLLLGTNSRKTVKIGTFLTLEGQDFYGNILETVTCKGCAVGCHPSKTSDGYNVCYPTCSGDCTKTETVDDNQTTITRVGRVKLLEDYEITLDINYIKGVFEERLLSEGIEASIDDVKIVSGNYVEL